MRWARYAIKMAWFSSISSATLPPMKDQKFRRVASALSSQLRRRRKELGLTQEDVADSLGIVARQYQKIESGKTNLTLRTLVRLSVALQVDLGDLF